MNDHFITSSRTRAVTTNYFDGGRRYAYRVSTAQGLECRIGDGDWAPFALFNDCRVQFVAADNNRVFILADDGRLYWRCIKEDSASWVVLMFELAALTRGTDAEPLIWDSFNPGQKHLEGVHYADRGLADWALAYRDWVRITHAPARSDDEVAALNADWAPGCLRANGWNSLEGRAGLPVVKGKAPEIIDIAVGNWNNTVITYYLLARSADRKGVALYFIDEETIMHEWQPVDTQPAALDSSSRILASHSVVAVLEGAAVYWTRLDAHQPGHIDVWPLNWTESWNAALVEDKWWEDLITQPFDLSNRSLPLSPANAVEGALLSLPPFDVLNADNYAGWHKAVLPADFGAAEDFTLDVGFGKRPWPVPQPGLFPRLPLVEPTRVASIVWKLYLLVGALSAVLDQMRGQERGTEIGFLGENPIKPNSAYPVCLVVRSGDRHLGVAVLRARDIREDEWEIVEPTSAGTTGGTLRAGLADLCHAAWRYEDECFAWVNEHFVCEEGGFERCAREEDQGYEECSRREDQGYSECSERRLRCPDWVPGWACDAANAAAQWVCVAWTWVSKLVCVAWTWVVKMVCVAWEFCAVMACATPRAAIKATCSTIAAGLKWLTCWAVSCWDR